MDRNPVTVTSDTDLRLARNRMVWAGVRYLPVVDGGELVGLLGERDIFLALLESSIPETVGAVMTTEVSTTTPGATTEAAAEQLEADGVGCLPVLDRGELVGLVTRADVLGAGVKVGMQRSSELFVEDVMTPEPAAIEESASVLAAIARMHDLGVRHLPVVDGDRRLVGILSDRDVRSSVGDPFRVELDRIERLRVGDVMTRDPLNAAVGDDVATVAQMFVDLRLSAVPVIDDSERLVGLVSYIDLLRGARG